MIMVCRFVGLNVVFGEKFQNAPHFCMASAFQVIAFTPECDYSAPRNGHFSLQNGHPATKCAVEIRQLTANSFFLPSYLLLIIAAR